jgi:hypothetical protein
LEVTDEALEVTDEALEVTVEVLEVTEVTEEDLDAKVDLDLENRTRMK